MAAAAANSPAPVGLQAADHDSERGAGVDALDQLPPRLTTKRSLAPNDRDREPMIPDRDRLDLDVANLGELRATRS
jgi:hypothetical protein